MVPRRISRHLIAAALAFAVLPRAEGSAARVPVVEIPPATELAPSILFQSEIPLDRFDPLRPSPERRRDFADLAARVAASPTSFLALQLRLDPVGTRAEQGRFAAEFLQVVAARLREAGVPPDRMILVPPERDPSWLDAFPWSGVEGRQSLRIRLLRGGEWLRRPPAAAAPPPAPPPPGGLFLSEPAEGKTDRALQLLRGSVEGDVRAVAVTVNRETLAAPVFGGRFEIPVSLQVGENRIAIAAVDSYGRPYSTARTVVYAPPRPEPAIAEPAAGSRVDISLAPAVTIRGKVRSRVPLRETVLEQNGMGHVIPVGPDGSFERKAILVTEQDVFRVESTDVQGEKGTSEPRAVASTTVAERPLLAFLHWDRGDADLDLRVSDGRGNESSFDAPDTFSSPRAIPNGRFWIDDRGGYGPEAFSVEDGRPGTYRFSVTYYRGRGPVRGRLTLVLFSGTPSRRSVRVVGPFQLSPEAPRLDVADVTLPSGTVAERIDLRERNQP